MKPVFWKRTPKPVFREIPDKWKHPDIRIGNITFKNYGPAIKFKSWLDQDNINKEDGE